MTEVRGEHHVPTSALSPVTTPTAPAELHRYLTSRDRPLSARELDQLATVLFWLDRPQESADAHRAAYTARLSGGDQAGLALAACWVFWDHALVGETSVAAGWLARARQHAAAVPGSGPAGWVAVAGADQSLAASDAATAVELAESGRRIGLETGDRDLEAMALQTRARALVALHDIRAGVALLDEAMVAVVAGELQPLFTGWVFCNVIGTCFDVADLRRAAEWTDAANRWSAGVGDGLLYAGICRLHAAELAYLRGAWAIAEAAARRACADLTAHDERYAGGAHLLLGEVRRAAGDPGGARAAYLRAHELGSSPHPGLALLWAEDGQITAAAEALRTELDPGPTAPLARSRLLAAMVDVELARAPDGMPAARAAADQLALLAEAVDSPYLTAMAAAADGSVRLAEDDPDGAVLRLRQAWSTFQGLGFPYDSARVQCRLADAARRSGDLATAELELAAGHAALRRLGDPSSQSPAVRLTVREIEVLRLVASGASNRTIGARLVLSEHTIARHVSNILTKTECRTRAAATAYAYEHHLV